MKYLFLIILFSLSGQPAFAQDVFNDDSFFSTWKYQRESSKTPAKTTPEKPKNIVPKQTPTSTNTSPTDQQSILYPTKTIFHDCKIWWQVALAYALFGFAFIFAIKRWSSYFNRWSRAFFYYILIIVGIAMWALHYYLHFYVFKYDLSFLCYNYWLVIGFEVVYFCSIYALVFGFRKSKIGKIL